MDRRVEAEPARLRAHDVPAGTVERRVLDHDLRKELDDRSVQLGVRDNVDRGPGVVGLQIEDAHAAGCREPLHERPVPLVLRVELQLELGRGLEPGESVAAGRDDEAHRPMLAPERVAEAEAVLPQREVERRTLERPAPVVGGCVHPRLPLEETEAFERRRERAESGLARWVELGEPVVVLGRVGHVLPTPLRTAAAQHDRCGHTRELRRHVDRPSLGPEPVRDQLEPAQSIPMRHQPAASRVTARSARIMRATNGMAARMAMPQTGQRI